MTTKYRIITGFSILLVLLGVMAFFGYSSLQTASQNFNSYRRLANVNVYASDLQSDVYEIMYFTERYLQERDPAYVKEALDRVDKGMELIRKNLELVTMESSIAGLKQAQALLDTMDDSIKNLQASVENMTSIYNRDCKPKLLAVEAALRTIGNGGRDARNVEILYAQGLLWEGVGLVRENVLLYQATLEPEVAASMSTALADMTKIIRESEAVMTSAAGRRDHAALSDAFKGINGAFASMTKAGVAAQNQMKLMVENGIAIVNTVTKVNNNADQLMRATGSATLESNGSSQFRVLLLSAFGLVIGVALALLIISTLVRTLRRMSTFAGDIAAGKFESQVQIKEKGEIGDMVQAVRHIPEIFREVINNCNNTVTSIASGRFRDRLQLEEYQGGFRELAKGVNAIADAYTSSIDSMPVAIVTVGPQLDTRYCNGQATKLVGQDLRRALGGKLPLLERSLREGSVNASENSLNNPEGRLVHVATTAMPLVDMHGATVGGLEVLTDISEIKEKQEIMLKVAAQASDISDRVAAASEELAAQVEEVSRGAEMQRQRVESTASAMTEMNSTVAEVAHNASQASQQSNNTRENAQNGAKLVGRVIAAIHQVQEVGARLESNMQGLGEQAESIGSVMNVISDIADQTNLLALNAAIEAARAGEAGRGFAVVADEVRKLAEKTMSATHEVGESISAIQESAQTNIHEVSIAVKSVGEATDLANESGEALREIVTLATATSTVVTSIATAAEEQSAASEEITASVDEINRLVGETTEGMIQSSEAVQDLSRTAQELRRVMESLH